MYGASDTSPAPIQNVRVDRRHLDVSLTEQFLHGPDIIPVFQEIRRERVAQGVAGRMLRSPLVAGVALTGCLRNDGSADGCGRIGQRAGYELLSLLSS